MVKVSELVTVVLSTYLGTENIEKMKDSQIKVFIIKWHEENFVIDLYMYVKKNNDYRYIFLWVNASKKMQNIFF